MILNDRQRDVLRFVLAANSGGYRPVADEVEEWRLRPDPQPGPKGKMISPAVPARPPASAVAAIREVQDLLKGRIWQDWDRLNQELGLSTAEWLRGGTPARYEPDGPPETLVASLLRLSWLTADESGRLDVSLLGRALLRAEDSNDVDAASVVLLQEGDPLAYAHVVGRVAESGAALIVDPYLKVQQLLDLLNNTEATRFLIGSTVSAGEVAAMKTVLSIDGWRGKRVVRQAPKGRIHDRFIVGDHGIHILGTSLNGVGKSTTTLLIPLPSEVESAVRGELEKTWEMATELACTPVAPATTPSTEQREEPRSSTQDNYAEDENRRSARKKPAAKKTTSRRAPRPKPSKSPE